MPRGAYQAGMGVACGDLNGDGRLDLMTVNGHISDLRPLFPWAMLAQLFLGGVRGRLTDITARRSAVPASPGRPRAGRRRPRQ